MNSLPKPTQKQVKNLFKEACLSDKVDEHGNWEFGAEFDKKGRGYAINWDLYAVGRDVHTKRTLIIIQIRKWEQRRTRGFANIRKSYFLIGRNEDKTTFAHSIESRVIHYAIKNGDCPIYAAQTWIFGADYKKVIRQGDIALVPVRAITKEAVNLDDKEIVILDSHKLEADNIYKNGVLYAKNPRLTHTPGTHPFVQGDGLYKIMVGRRASYHDFAAPTID